MSTKRRRTKDDCLRQCVARVLGLKPHRVPHFVKKHKGRWKWHLAQWLHRRGLVLIESRRGVNHGVERWINIGRTKHPRWHHAVVMSSKVKGGVGGVLYDGGNPLRKVIYSIFILRDVRRGAIKARRRS